MAKFDFNTCRYAGIFTDEPMMRMLIDDYININNYAFWTTQEEVDTMMTPTNGRGAASFSQAAIHREVTPMMDMRAPLGKGKPIDKEGYDFYTGTIPDFITPVVVETAAEREYKRRLFEQYGTDAKYINDWLNSTQGLVDSANQTMSNMTAQLLSTGAIDYKFGRGIKSYVQKVPIPAENFVKAGEKVWTAADCKILTQMVKIEQDFRNRTGFDGAMKWQIPYDLFINTFMTNAEVKDWVKFTKALVGIVVPDTFASTVEETIAAMSKYESLSAIEVIREKQKDYSGMVSGWKDGVVVLRPVGYAGVIKQTEILDVVMSQNYGSSVIEKVFAQTGMSGLFTVVNTTLNNGEYKEWHTELVASAVPTLSEFPYHVIVDTKTAND